MKDVTSTSFGLLIAFLLPGLAGIYSSRFWSQRVDDILGTFETAESNVGLFFMVVLAAVAVSLQVTVFRWLIFERWLCRRDRLSDKDFAQLGTNDKKLVPFRAAVDEHYRYHQFWGGMTVVLPFLFAGWYLQTISGLPLLPKLTVVAVLLLMEVLTAIAAIYAFENYVTRARAILGGTDAKRLEEEEKGTEEDSEKSN